MLDSPRSFIIIIASIVIAITLFIFGGKIFRANQENSTNLNPVINEVKTGTSNTTQTGTTKTTAPVVKQSNTGSVTPKTTTDYLVTYTNSGFTPSSLTIKAGKSVRFLNQAGASMYVMASPSPSSGGLSEFDQGRSVGKDGYYDFTFNRKGSFLYFNNNKKTDSAVITVQ